MKPYAASGGKPVFNEGITPIGLFCHLYHDKPQLKTKDQHGRIPDMDENGIQKAEFKATLAWSKTRENELMDIHNMAMLTQEQGWPGSTAPGAFHAMEPFFRDGDNPAHNTENREYLRGRYYLNFKGKAKAARDPLNPNNIIYSGAPGLLGPYGPEDLIMPIDVWPGCTGRVSFIMFATEYMGKHFISTRLQNIQKYDEGDGTRIGGGQRPTAASQFGALKEGQGGQFPGGNAGMFGLGGGQQPGNGFAGAGMGSLGSMGNAGTAGPGANSGNMFGGAGTNQLGGQQQPQGGGGFGFGFGGNGGRSVL